MIYKNDNHIDKQYSVVNNLDAIGLWTIREFVNKVKKTELTLNSEEVTLFKNRLKDNGWYEYIHR